MILRFIRDFVLISLPVGALSAFFFLGHETGWGIFIGILTLATLWYIRPNKPSSLPTPTAADEADADTGSAGIGQVGGPI